MRDSDWLKIKLRLICLICVQTQILCNGAIITHSHGVHTHTNTHTYAHTGHHGHHVHASLILDPSESSNLLFHIEVA